MAKDIKKVIKDFVTFDIENNYYQNEDKDEMVRNFKKIVYEDDQTIRQFLQEFFTNTKELAQQYDLVDKEGEAEETKPEDETETTEEPEETPEEVPEEPEEVVPEEETKKESVETLYIRKASQYLYE
jgi:hypothetical protein